MPLLIKIIISAVLIALIGEFSKRSDRIGAMVASLPLITFLTLIWMYFEGRSIERISAHAWYTFWYVLPTLPMFLIFPWILSRFGFWISLGISVAITLFCLLILGKIVENWGVRLF